MPFLSWHGYEQLICWILYKKTINSKLQKKEKMLQCIVIQVSVCMFSSNFRHRNNKNLTLQIICCKMTLQAKTQHTWGLFLGLLEPWRFSLPASAVWSAAAQTDEERYHLFIFILCSHGVDVEKRSDIPECWNDLCIQLYTTSRSRIWPSHFRRPVEPLLILGCQCSANNRWERHIYYSTQINDL